FITAGPDGALWFTEINVNTIGRITTAGAVSEFTLPGPSVSPADITPGPDGSLWFTEFTGAGIGRIGTDGTVGDFKGPITDPLRITTGPDGALWFTESFAGKIGRLTFPAPAVSAGGAGTATAGRPFTRTGSFQSDPVNTTA